MRETGKELREQSNNKDKMQEYRQNVRIQTKCENTDKMWEYRQNVRIQTKC